MGTLTGMRDRAAITAFRIWPTYIGAEKLMNLLHLPRPVGNVAETKVKGFPLTIRFSPQTYMGLFLYYRGIYEEGVIRRLVDILQPGMTFLDVGANVGLYSIIAGFLVKEKGKVLAVEPQIRASTLLEENIRINGLNNVSIERVALGEEECVQDLYQVSRTNDGQATLRIRSGEETFGKAEKVRVRTAESVLQSNGLRQLDGMKIDVEGAELAVLNGLKGRFESGHGPSFIFFECIDEHLMRFGDRNHRIFEFLQNYGYTITCLYRGNWRSVTSTREHAKFGRSSDMLAIKE